MEKIYKIHAHATITSLTDLADTGRIISIGPGYHELYMNQQLRADTERIVLSATAQVMPGEAVRRALEGRSFGSGRLILVSAGKAAWSMGKAA